MKDNKLNESIAKSALQLQSIFNFIKTSAANFEGAAKGEVQAFLWDLINMSEIGYEASFSIWKEIQQLPTSEQIELTIAEQLSNLIGNDNVPLEISEAIQDALTDIQNASKQKEVLEYERSPEYIAKVLSDYKQNND